MDSLDPIKRRIYEIRGRKVMLDSDLAELYAVETKNLKRAVRANIERFPDDFMFELTKEEYDAIRCKNFTLKIEGDALRCKTFTSKHKNFRQTFTKRVPSACPSTWTSLGVTT